jgi:preprotein translocase subunit SecF
MDIIGKRYYFFALSLLVIIPGMIALAIWKFPLAIDFTGGSSLEVQFQPGVTPQPGDVVNLFNDLKLGQPQVQSSVYNGKYTLIIRSAEMAQETKSKIEAEMEKRFNSKITEVSFDTVGPSIGAEVATAAAGAVVVAAVGILFYLWFAFRGVPHAFRFGTAAIIAMLHDVAVIVGIEAIFGKVLGWQVDSLFLTALLTVIGFSVHDTIVVFDRIRENSSIYSRLPFETVVNHSTVQTLDRSINTQLTVIFTLFAMALFGGVTIRHFVITLMIGMISGTYSSIFNAAAILVVWENKEWKYWFKGNWKRPSKTVTAN